MSQDPNAPQQSSGWSKTKTGFTTVGKGAGAARTGINSGLSKLDSMSITSKGINFKKQLSAGNVLYDRENHVSRPKQDVSHFAPPPRRIPGQAPPPRATPTIATKTDAAVRPPAPSPGPRQTPSVPSAPRPGSSSRLVPPPPPAAAAAASRNDVAEDALPVYTPVPSNTATATSAMNGLTSKFGNMRASPAPIAPKPTTGVKPSSTPSMDEAKSVLGSAKTMSGLYGKYGNQQQGQKTATPSWSEIKAGASAAQNLHAFHGKYAPKEGGTAVVQTTSSPPIVVPKPMKAVPAPAALKAPISTPSPKPPLPRNKPNLGPPKEYCIGLYSFDAQALGDLSFGVGDRIEVLERTDDPEAWWKGKHQNGQEGIFPANYCRLEIV